MFCTFIKEKLRQLRDNIIGKRPEDENACGEWQLPATQKMRVWLGRKCRDGKSRQISVQIHTSSPFPLSGWRLSHSSCFSAKQAYSLIHTRVLWPILTNQCSTTSIWCLFNLWIRLSCRSVFSLFILWAIYNHCPLYIQRGRPFLVHSSSQLSTCELFYILCLLLAFAHNQCSFPLLIVRSCPWEMTRVKGQCHKDRLWRWMIYSKIESKLNYCYMATLFPSLSSCTENKNNY